MRGRGPWRQAPPSPNSWVPPVCPPSTLPAQTPSALSCTASVFCLLNPSTIFCPFQPREDSEKHSGDCTVPQSSQPSLLPVKAQAPDLAFRSPRDPVPSCLSTRNPRSAPSPQEQSLCSQQALCVHCYHSGENVLVPTPLGGPQGPDLLGAVPPLLSPLLDPPSVQWKLTYLSRPSSSVPTAIPPTVSLPLLLLVRTWEVLCYHTCAVVSWRSFPPSSEFSHGQAGAGFTLAPRAPTEPGPCRCWDCPGGLGEKPELQHCCPPAPCGCPGGLVCERVRVPGPQQTVAPLTLGSLSVFLRARALLWAASPMGNPIWETKGHQAGSCPPRLLHRASSLSLQPRRICGGLVSSEQIILM